MSAFFQILGSSSSGNCSLLRTENSTVLIDAGFSGKRIEQMLMDIGESIHTIDAVFLTHEHSDHAQGIRGLSKRGDLPIFANRDTAEAIQRKLCKQVNWNLFQTGTTFRFRDIEVGSFTVPHDAYDPVGFTFHWGKDDDLLSPRRSLAWVTDLGYVPEYITEYIKSVQILVLEANYDEELLEIDSKRPWSIKQRIRGRHGHLSNNACYEVVKNLNGKSDIQEVYLAHLSRDCNTVEHVKNKFAEIVDRNCNFTIHVVDPLVSAKVPVQALSLNSGVGKD
jgi:phosphoribosyl 1,2-cyclic phosphodiesterase